MAKYTPDFVLEDGRILEIKGRLTSADRKKLLAVLETNPTVSILLVFQRPNNPIYKGSSTTCAEWATKNGIGFIDAKSFEEFLNENY